MIPTHNRVSEELKITYHDTTCEICNVVFISENTWLYDNIKISLYIVYIYYIRTTT